MQYDVVVLSYRKPAHALRAIDRLKVQSLPPDNIYVWHNAPCVARFAGVVNIYADVNFGCRARHAFGLLCLAPVVVFVDDDILLSRNACKILLNGKERHPQCVVGYSGRKCLGDYSDGHEIDGRHVHVDTPVDIVKGFFHAVERELLVSSFEFAVEQSDASTLAEDDIILSETVSAKTGNANYVIAGFSDTDIVHQLHETGNQHRTDHYERRDSAISASRTRFVGKSSI